MILLFQDALKKIILLLSLAQSQHKLKKGKLPPIR